MSHVYISYVREDKEKVDRLCQVLKSHGVNVWLDRNDIKPGARWKDAIRQAIRQGDFFIACFSSNYTSKTKTYMNEELTLAVEELRAYSSDRIWFIPVLLSEVDVPARSIGFGETLLDINWVPLYDDWDAGIRKILSVIHPSPDLLLQEAASISDLSQLYGIITQLPEMERGILSEKTHILQLVNKICRLQTRLNTIERPASREPFAEQLCAVLKDLLKWISGFQDPLADQFNLVVKGWLGISHKQLQLIKAVLSKDFTPQVFRAGDPVDRDNEAFVPRYNVLNQLEKQIMLSTGCPGLIIYGRRRMGKSTILKNLMGFLPKNVLLVAISLLHPEAFSSFKSFFSYLTKSILRELKYTIQLPDDFDSMRSLFKLLSDYNTLLQREDKRLLLAFDEYEMIDKKISDGVFPEELLVTIRESIQNHRRLTWIFAGSHEINELQAPWTSHLISTRTIELSEFTLNETRLLLTEPLRYSSLWPKNSPERPKFVPEFWGDGGIERVHSEAGGWPHLVQLIAETVIDLLNDESIIQVNDVLLDRALDQAIVRGHNVLYELMHRESQLPGEWEYLSGFRNKNAQRLSCDEAVYQSLRRRHLIEEECGKWHLRVPLMARWLQKRG